MPAISDRLFVRLQRLLPARLLGAAVAALAGIRVPWIKDWQIRRFVRSYGIDVKVAARTVPDGYASLNEFFTRELRPGARPVDPDPLALVSPADGRLDELGSIRSGQLLQAKGHRYSLANLLALDATDAARFEGGAFVTVYLAPHDYHRVHAPLDLIVDRVVHVPGRRLAVNPRSVGAEPGLFARNERVICHGRHHIEPVAVVFVGALNVASISIATLGPVRGDDSGRASVAWQSSLPGLPPRSFTAGAELGRFNLGSTVIVAVGPGLATRWRADLTAGSSVRMGQRLGTLGETGAGTA